MVVVRLGAYLFNIPKQQNYVFSKCWVALISCQHGPIGEEWAKYLGRWLNYELAPPVQNRPSTTLKAAVVYFYFGKEFLAVRRCTSPFGERYKLVFGIRLSALNRRTGDCKHSNGGAVFGFRITDLCSRAPILKNQRLILFFPADGEHFISAHVCRGGRKIELRRHLWYSANLQHSCSPSIHCDSYFFPHPAEVLRVWNARLWSQVNCVSPFGENSIQQQYNNVVPVCVLMVCSSKSEKQNKWNTNLTRVL